MSVKSKSQLKRLAVQQGRKDEGMLTREQIEQSKREGPGVVTPEYWAALHDLALAALDLRERAAKVCDEYMDYTYGLWRDEGKSNTYMRACSDAGETLAERIRALPLTPSGADQQNSPPEQELPASSVSAASVSPHRGSLGSEAPDVQQPARAGEPRCHDLLRTISGEPYFCLECGSSLPMDGSCWKRRTQA